MPIPDESVINFNQMNLSSNVIVINPSLFRPTSLPLLKNRPNIRPIKGSRYVNLNNKSVDLKYYYEKQFI